jgi:hypothetical protein
MSPLLRPPGAHSSRPFRHRLPHSVLHACYQALWPCTLSPSRSRAPSGHASQSLLFIRAELPAGGPAPAIAVAWGMRQADPGFRRLPISP